MNFTSRMLRLAVLQLFKDANVDPGEALSLFELGDSWLATGLRASDLREGLHHLLDSGDLVGVNQGHKHFYSLTDKAHSGLHRPDGELCTMTVEEEAIFALARSRVRSGFRPEMRRRAEDLRDSGAELSLLAQGVPSHSPAR